MNEFKVLSGIEYSKIVNKELSVRIKSLKLKNTVPCLAAILVGENPASEIYVRSKRKMFESMRIKSRTFRLDSECKEKDILDLIHELNFDSNFHGILVQLPLPGRIDSQQIISAIDPLKDVDGFHPENVGLLSIGKPRFVPCTPKGIMRIFEIEKISLNGKHIVVIGRSNIVGRPISILTSLKGRGMNATTTICHSATKDIKKHTKSADILISAIGIPNFIDGSMLKNNSIVIDVGINRIINKLTNKTQLVGDANWKKITNIASAATPVPGGVGPMTIAMLLENTIVAAERKISSQ